MMNVIVNKVINWTYLACPEFYIIYFYKEMCKDWRIHLETVNTKTSVLSSLMVCLNFGKVSAGEHKKDKNRSSRPNSIAQSCPTKFSNDFIKNKEILQWLNLLHFNVKEKRKENTIHPCGCSILLAKNNDILLTVLILYRQLCIDTVVQLK
jgi:hypothetical protein